MLLSNILVLGIDPGINKCGLVLMMGDNLIHQEVIKPIKNDFRKEQIADRITEVIDQFNPKALAIETSYFSANIKVAMELANLRGFIQGTFYNKTKSNKIINITPAEAKAVLGLGGRVKRKESKEQVRRVLTLFNKKFADLPEDVLDAIAITMAGRNKI